VVPPEGPLDNEGEFGLTSKLRTAANLLLPAMLLAACLHLAACGQQAADRSARQSPRAISPPPLEPLEANTPSVRLPSSTSAPGPISPLFPAADTKAPLIAPQSRPVQRRVPTTGPATASAPGTIVASGHLQAGGEQSGWHFVFDQPDAPAGLKEAQVLPNQRLEQMAAIVDKEAQPVLFHIAAEVIRYKEQQYLVIRGAQYDSPKQPSAEDQP
jgi:hypothetical protein